MLLKAWIIGLVVLCWTCSGDDHSDDAGQDSGDASQDAADAFDVGVTDVGSDTPDATNDAIADADSDASADLVWTPMPGMPDGCEVDFARQPASLLEVDWVECGSGCEHLATAERAWAWDTQVTTGQTGEVGFFSLLGEMGSRQRVTLLADTSGAVWGAWRQPEIISDRVCAVGAPHVGGNQVGFVIRVLLDETFRQERIYYAPVDALTSPLEPIEVLTPPGFPLASAAQPLLASATTVAARVPTFSVYMFQEGELDILGGVAPVTGSPQLLNLVGDHALWSNFTTNVNVVHGRVGQPADVYYEVEGVRIDGFSTDGTDAAWIQCYGWDAGAFTCERYELWAAAYEPDPADLRPRLVREIPGGGRSYVAGGMYLQQNLRSLEGWRLSDGTRFVYDLDGLGVIYGNEPVFRLTDEVGYATRIGGVGTLLRVRYDAFTAEPLE